MALYLSGRSPSPSPLNKNDVENDSEEEDSNNGMSFPNISAQMPHTSPNLYNFMNKWVATNSQSSPSLTMTMSPVMASTSSLLNLSHTNSNPINSLMTSNPKVTQICLN